MFPYLHDTLHEMLKHRNRVVVRLDECGRSEDLSAVFLSEIRWCLHSMRLKLES